MDKLTGFAIVFASTILYASINPLLKKASGHISPFTIIAISTFIVFVLSVAASIITEKGLSIKVDVLKSYLPFIIMASVVNIFAFWLAIVGFKYMPVWQQSMFMLLSPVAAGILSYFLLGENINPNLFVGLLIMGFGLIVALK